MNRYVPGRMALRVAWASLMVVFVAYLAVAIGLGGSGLLDVFSSWVAIALVLGAATMLALRAFAGDARRGPWLALAAAAGLWVAGGGGYQLFYARGAHRPPDPTAARAGW